MNVRNFFLLSTTAFLFSTAVFAQTETWQVVRQAKCTKHPQTGCLKIKKGWLGITRTFHGNVEGFTYQTGIPYKIEVSYIPNSNNVNLVKIVSPQETQEQPTTTSGIVFDKKLEIVRVNDTKISSNKAHIIISSKDQIAYGNGGCNSISASFTTNTQGITFGDVTSTLMACSGQKLMEGEQAITNAFNHQTYQIVQSGNNVYFQQNGKTIIETRLQDPKKVAKELQGGFWQLIALNGVRKNFDKMGIQFNLTDSTMSGFSGCNRVSGKINFVNNTLATQQLMTTRMGCRNEEAQKDESTFLEVFTNAHFEVDITQNILILRKDGKVQAMFHKMK